MCTCSLQIAVAAMGGALSLLLLLIAVTLLTHPFSDHLLRDEHTRHFGQCILHNDNRHEGQAQRLHDVTGTSIRGPGGLCSATGGDGSGTSGRGVSSSKRSGGGTFNHLQQEPRSHTGTAQT